jgi:hypothetical protein
MTDLEFIKNLVKYK